MRSKRKPSLLLFSFFADLRQNDRKAFVFVIACMVVQLVLTALKMEATPFLLYGMFSEKQALTDTVSTTSIKINGKPLGSYGLSLREQQLLETTLGNYLAMKNNNDSDPLQTWVEYRHPGIIKWSVYPWLSEKIYNTPGDLQRFRNWFRHKCIEVVNKSEKATENVPSVNSEPAIQIIRTTYFLNRPSLHPTVVRNETLEVL